MAFGSSIGKYRDLAVAITLFLLLDLGVLVFSFYVASQIRGDASRINASSEIRMLTQQATKSLLTLKDETVQGLPNQTSLAQLASVARVFDDDLTRLATEFDAALADPIQKLLLGNRMVDNGAQLARVRKIWNPLGEALIPVLEKPDPRLEVVEYAATKAVAINIKLMAEADDLTQMLESTAADRANSLKQVQIVGILLAMLNFVFIVFKFLRSLNAGDRQVMAAKHETDNILASVKEGLLLVRRDGAISAQYSASLPAILGVAIKPGGNISDLLRECLPETESEAAVEYVELLLSGRVKARMVKQLNPLQEVRLAVGLDRYVAFDFTPVAPLSGTGDVSSQEALLIAVFDVTEKKALELAVTDARAQAKAEGEILTQVVNSDAGILTAFLGDARQQLDLVNAALRDVKADALAYRALVDIIFRAIHSIKGQSAMLGLRSIELEAHRFEDLLVKLRRRGDYAGSELIPVSLAMSDLKGQLEKVERVAEKLLRFASAAKAGQEKSRSSESASGGHAIGIATNYLSDLAQRIADDEKKEVTLNTQFGSQPSLPGRIAEIAREVLPQLVRNAVVHGIETPGDREQLGKPRQGRISLSIQRDANQDISILVRDDGRGVSFEAIRHTLTQSGRMSAREVGELSEQQLVSQMFEIGVSTAQETGLHAGRGVGLDVVRDIVAKAGGRIRVRSRQNEHTEFILKFPHATFA